jgi:hypothetical protein
MSTKQLEFRQYYSENLWLYIDIKVNKATQMFTGKPFIVQLSNQQKSSFVDLLRGKSNKKREQAFYDFINSVETTCKRNIPMPTNRFEFKYIYFTPSSCVTELSSSELKKLRKKILR